MSTRAVFTFHAYQRDTFHVYKHCDGYPEYARETLFNALPYAWPLPRFEPDDFAAAFIAGNKSKGGGNVYISEGWKSHADLSYRYEITCWIVDWRLQQLEKLNDANVNIGDLEIKIYVNEGKDDSSGNQRYKQIWKGILSGMGEVKEH